MAHTIRRVDYFYMSIADQPGEGYKLLNTLAGLNINLLAFSAIPIGPTHTQLILFPNSSENLQDVATKTKMVVDGPHPAFLVQGDDELGMLAKIHEKLYDEKINVYASNGVTDGKGNFGYIFYVRPEQYDEACEALGI